MKLNPKGLIGLGKPTSLRPYDRNKGVGGEPVPPSGFVFFVKPDGTYWTNASGAYYLKAVA